MSQIFEENKGVSESKKVILSNENYIKQYMQDIEDYESEIVVCRERIVKFSKVRPQYTVTNLIKNDSVNIIEYKRMIDDRKNKILQCVRNIEKEKTRIKQFEVEEISHLLREKMKEREEREERDRIREINREDQEFARILERLKIKREIEKLELEREEIRDRLRKKMEEKEEKEEKCVLVLICGFLVFVFALPFILR
jgi:hypothetical protein